MPMIGVEPIRPQWALDFESSASASSATSAGHKQKEARTGFEPAIEVLQTSALPLGDRAKMKLGY